MANRIANLLGNTKTRTMVLLVVGVLIFGVVIAISQTESAKTGDTPERVSKTTEVPNQVKSTPGEQVSRKYKELQDQANKRGAEEAAKKGTTFIPTLTGNAEGYDDKDFDKQLSAVAGDSGGKCSKSTVAQLKQQGMDTTKIILELKSYGCSAAAIAALFSPDEIAAALLAMNNCANPNAKGCTADDAKKLKDQGADAAKIAATLKEKGCTMSNIATALKGVGFTSNDIATALKSAGATPAELAAALKAAGASPAEIATAMKAAGISTNDIAAAMKGAGISTADISAGLKAAGVSPAELAAALKAAGASNAEIASAMKSAGYSAADIAIGLKAAGASPSEIAAALKAAGSDPAEIAAALRASGASAEDIASALKASGVSASDIASALSKAGFSNAEILPALAKSGFSSSDIAKAMAGLDNRGSDAASLLAQQQAKDDAAQRLAAQQEAQQLAAFGQQRQAKMQELMAAMEAQKTAVMQTWNDIPQQAMVAGEWATKKEKDAAAGGSAAGGVAGSAGTAANQEAPKIILKAGTILFAVLDTAVNSDEDGPIMATIVSGSLKGSKLMGKMQVKTEAEKVALNFTAINMPGETNSMGISAVAIDPDTARTALASDVDHHYLMRWGSLFASSFVQGYASAVANAGQTSTTNQGAAGSTTTTTSPPLTGRQQLFEGLGAIGTKWSEVVAKNFDRPITMTIDQGTGIGILITADLTYGSAPTFYTPTTAAPATTTAQAPAAPTGANLSSDQTAALISTILKAQQAVAQTTTTTGTGSKQ